MKTTHTPGPWHPHALGLARSGEPEFEIHWSADGECVAEVVHGEANARLIAAAPELLDALKGMVNLAKWMDDVSNEGFMLDDRFDAAMAAIAKATGGAP